MTRARPLLDLVLLGLLAAAALALAPSGPRPWLGAGGAIAAVSVVALAAAAGAALAAAVDRAAGRPPAVPPPGLPAGLLLLLAAAGEEAVWRGGVLAALAAPAGTPGALALSALAFGAVHGPSRERRALHAGTGLAFGAAFLAGGLAAAVACHCAYAVVLLAGGHRPVAGRARGRGAQ